jgi:hypothetical protein
MNIMASNFLPIEAIALNRLCFISFGGLPYDNQAQTTLTFPASSDL